MAKKSKMKNCKHCGQEIAASAKICPHCGGKNKKPIFKRVWFWLLIVFLFLVIIGSGGESEPAGPQKVGTVGPQEATAAPGAETQVATEPVQTIFKVGDILHDGDMDIVYAASGDYQEENPYSQPQDGYKYIFLRLAFINTSDQQDTSVSSFSFDCYADGYACEAHYNSEDDLSATLSAGRSTMGSIYFQVPADAKEIEVEYTTNYFTEDKITFVFEGDQDSGYVLEKNAAATPGALNVGDCAESSSLNINYLACYEDSSNNQFINPKDGYTYVTCELEFENKSNSDLHVSYFDFDCYADGANCAGAYYRDDMLSATLSAGRKAKGTVTFEVPVDAAVIEVEYLTNYWTSNRVVFNANIK